MEISPIKKFSDTTHQNNNNNNNIVNVDSIHKINCDVCIIYIVCYMYIY